MNHYAVLAIGRDQGGIVAAITGTLHELGCNIETSQMAILGDQFSMMMVVRGDSINREDLRQALRDAGTDSNKRQKYEIVVCDIEDYNQRPPTEASHLITVYCEDKGDVLSRISKELNQHDVNITHLHSRVHMDGAAFCIARVYIALPSGVTEADLESALAKRLREAGYDTYVRIERLERDP